MNKDYLTTVNTTLCLIKYCALDLAACFGVKPSSDQSVGTECELFSGFIFLYSQISLMTRA
jgi:hypothetical protein